MSPKVTEEYKEKRRLEILEVAEKVFTEKGYEKTTMKDIVEESGFSRGGVYQYFSSTEEMFRAIVKELDKRTDKQINDILSSTTPIWIAVTNIVNSYRNQPDISFAAVQFEYTVTGWRESDRYNYTRDRSQFFRDRFAEVIEEGVRRGEFKPLQPIQAIVDFTLNAQDGFLLWHQLLGEENKKELEGQIDALIFYLEGVLQVDHH
ncbi:TetR/AcrR family transcriptional regulator [Bacillus salitolerans]|uniref:TetR/AcrR family transcriptional regulator n=1 Tax=Bacillus salitolerans TaxID=1437434 RepID=A0ABW4LRD4_9BACI